MKNITEEARRVAHSLLEGFGLLEKDDDQYEGEEVKGRYVFDVRFERGSLIINIKPLDDPTGEIGAVLIGRECTTLTALQRVFFVALGYRMGGRNSIHHPVWLNVNGRRPDLRQTSDEREEAPAGPKVVKITVNAPEGVKVELATTTG